MDTGMSDCSYCEEPRLTARELRAARMLMGLTQRELAQVLRLGRHGDRAVRRYENGESMVPGPVSALVELLIDERRPFT
jgi:transcriptional regulator with XRE-family HTH domain